MLVKKLQMTKRKGQALVEYALLIAGIAVASVVGIAVLGHKVSDQYALMAIILPGAHADDNNVIQSSNSLIPFKATGGVLALDTAGLTGGKDRTAGLIGVGGGETLIPDYVAP